MPKVQDKERILKASREKQLVTYRGVPIGVSADFSKEILQARRGWKEIFSHKKQGPTAKIALASKADKELSRQEKTKGVHHHQTIIT